MVSFNPAVAFTDFAGALKDYMFIARERPPDELPWPVRLFIILLGYSTVIVPAWLLIKYISKKANSALGFEPRTIVGRFLKAFAVGNEDYRILDQPSGVHRKEQDEKKPFLVECANIIYHFLGIQCTLVMMGFFQERIITHKYARLDNTETLENFGDGQFLVFCNRIVALFFCGIVLYMKWSKLPPHVPPYYKHGYTSFANTMSSWCQYEALKYVSFPTQTICKASKVVTTMLMGRIVRRQRYTWAEYANGAGIAFGAGMFLLNSGGGHSMDDMSTSFSGLILMVGYLIFDSFTLNWQKSLFDTRPKVSKYQMMLGVNLFSAILCFVSLLEQGTLASSLKFAFEHNKFINDVFFLSLSGAVGQLFIYSAIDTHGPIIFSIIMTIRQMLSILLSAVYYGHQISAWSAIGFIIVFSFIFYEARRKYSNESSGRQTTKSIS